MEEQDFNNTANVEHRRKFFGIDAEEVKNQEFSLSGKDDVEKFDVFIKNYVEEETHLPFLGFNLPRWYEKCRAMGANGGRLFASILDLNITLAFVFIDFSKTNPGHETINCREYPDILSDHVLFKKRIVLLHDTIDMAIRYRSFYDKLMGVLVLLFCPSEYHSFIKADSRKKEFKKKMSGIMDSEFLESLYTIISQLDDRFRTAEIHQAGRMRKWVLGGRDSFLDNAIDLEGFFNSILNLAIWVDKLVDEVR